jgi:HK97 family phage prohead protease
MNTELRTRVASDLRFLAASGDAPDRIQAKALVYGAVSEDMGGWREVFAPGSVELDPDLRMLNDHQTAMVLGRVSAGTLDAMDDGSGIVATAYPPDTSWARDLRVSMERGDIDQMSFRFQALEDDVAWVPSEAAPDGGYVLRTVLRALISEVSVVAMPAYPQTVALARASVSGELRRRVWSALPVELREGKVLSQENMAALIQIHDLTEAVLSGADPNWAEAGVAAGEDGGDGDANDTGAAGERANDSSDFEVTAGAGGSPADPSRAGSAPHLPSSRSATIWLPGVGLRSITQGAWSR